MIHRLMRAILEDPECVVLPRNGQPSPAPEHSVPPDLALFYEQCGGVTLFPGANAPLRILPPDRVVLANPVIVGQRCEGDRTASWYVVADDLQSNYVTIDMFPTRLGRCYDSHFDRHGVAGSCPVVAHSFTELLQSLYRARGVSHFWLSPGFRSLGDAYG